MNSPERVSYEHLPGFDGYYLEDSYVLAIEQHPDTLSFLLEAVLTPQHRLYHQPRPGRQYCYARVRLTFPATTRVTWLRQEMHPIVGPDGEADYGNIEAFSAAEGAYQLEGEWGEVEIESAPPVIETVE